MKHIDLSYLAISIGDLAGVPVRIYEGDKMTLFHSLQDFPADPIKPYVESVLNIGGNVGYFVTPYFNYYGVVRNEKKAIVIGPSRLTPMSDKDLRDLAFSCDVVASDVERFISAMKGLVQMPLESILQILCTVNHVLNGERLSLKDVAIYDLGDGTDYEVEINTDKGWDEGASSKEAIHNTLALETHLMDIVSRGDVQALTEWVEVAPAVRGGRLADDACRQMKNTFIVSTTLTTRAAIRGGVDIEEALSLSDSYIRKCEILSTAEQIINLQYRMILDYTRRVEMQKSTDGASKLISDVTRYVRRNISGRTSVEDMARSMFISRTHLAAKFKQLSGMTLTDFILSEKTKEAKRLLVSTDKSLLAIGEYLGFSSQSHFTKVFKKYSGKTPSEYRNEKEATGQINSQ